MSAAVDVSPVVAQVDALVSSVPKATGATVQGAQAAIVDALDIIERNAALLVWEAERQRKTIAERERQARADADASKRKIDARKALADRAAARASGRKSK